MLKFHLPLPQHQLGWLVCWSPPPFATKTDHVKKTWAASVGQEENIIVEPYYTFKSPSEPSSGPASSTSDLIFLFLPCQAGCLVSWVLDGQTLQILNYTVYKTFSWHLQKKYFEHYFLWKPDWLFWILEGKGQNIFEFWLKYLTLDLVKRFCF